jgi:phytoene/squalene synthetase
VTKNGKSKNKVNQFQIFNDMNNDQDYLDCLNKVYNEDESLDKKISLNPILQSFQLTVHQYNISYDLIKAFLHSMEMDLSKQEYERNAFDEYVYGSAEVVGLMCLKVFTEGNQAEYDKLKGAARSLGGAFQKINFLRDIKSDYAERGRTYFPGIDLERFSKADKLAIEHEIEEDFKNALEGILTLPKGAKSGVYLAYKYYMELFKKIRKTSPDRIMNERIRVRDEQKLIIYLSTYFQSKLKII